MGTGYTGFDLETLDADELFTAERGTFIRLYGMGPHVLPAPSKVMEDGLRSGTPLVGHNSAFFDALALDRHAGIPVERTLPNGRDLRLAAFQNDPPSSYETRSGPGFKSYSLDALGERYLGIAKSGAGKALAKEFGGWNNIPVDEPRYVQYCRDDVALTEALDAAIPWDPYERREMWVATLTARATLTGFRVDVDGLRGRVAALTAQADAGRTMLAEQYGFPTLNKQGKVAKAPQRTEAGKVAFYAALAAVGFPVDNWPRGADGLLSLDKETMSFALEHARTRVPAAVDVIAAVSEMNGVRNSAANVLDHLVDDRVHYGFEPFQATGRWSNGLSVLKKGVADSEREFFLPDSDDHVLVSIDLDQIDIRAAAAHAQDYNLIALLNDPARDIHQEIAERTGVDRKPAKTLDLGWLYGRGIRGMVENTAGVTLAAAQGLDRYMREQFPSVLEWQRQVRELGEAGLHLDNGFGRRLRVDPDRAFTQAPASVGQSTTRDIIAEGIIALQRKAPDVARMLRMIVHDEVVASIPRADAVEVATLIQDCMSRQWAPAGKDRPVNITAGQGKPFVFGETWGALYR